MRVTVIRQSASARTQPATKMPGSPPVLTAQQHAEYQRNGWVLVPGVFTAAELAPLHAACDELLLHCGPLVPGNPRIQLEPETLEWQIPVVRKLEPVIDASPPLAALVHDPRMTQAAADVLGEDVHLYEDKLNYKPPHVGSSYPLHQDRSYWEELAPGVPSTDRLVTVTLLLDDATPENGCLRLVSGSQHGLMELQEGDSHALKADVMTAVDAPGRAGDLLLFSCYTAHHSFANRSNRGRRALLCTYNPVSDGDTYDVYKGAHGVRCREWLAKHGPALTETAPLRNVGGSEMPPRVAAGSGDNDPRFTSSARPPAASAEPPSCLLPTTHNETTPPYRVALNWDGAPHGYSPVGQTTEDFLSHVFAPTCGTSVDALFWCVGEHTTTWMSEELEAIGERTGRIYESVQSWTFSENVRRMLERGESPLRCIIERGHELGISVFASLRMNDNHFQGAQVHATFSHAGTSVCMLHMPPCNASLSVRARGFLPHRLALELAVTSLLRRLRMWWAASRLADAPERRAHRDAPSAPRVAAG